MIFGVDMPNLITHPAVTKQLYYSFRVWFQAQYSLSSNSVFGLYQLLRERVVRVLFGLGTFPLTRW